ncbi:MAG TPA: adenylate/guanylate cyclase domain-containing protein [Vitreimonas sp.]|nr:adenylate/guanylate cyclase domain-containing protein [Vitreimonas sp.]
MADGRTERRLTAILAADVAGYARMLRADEAVTLARFKDCIETLAPLLAAHRGRIIKTMGDGVLAAFASAVEALSCAVEFQRAMAARNAALPPDARMIFRVGVNAGDVIIEGDDVFGDAVALAARLEASAQPGGVCVSARVRDDARGRTDFVFEDMGERKLKNIDTSERLFRVRLDAAPARPAIALPDRPSIAVLPFDNMSGDEEEYFADAVTEDIIGALSRWRWFFVIARNTSFIYKGKPVDVAQVGRELGVRYVLEGSVRRSATRVRVVAQLIDAADATHIWSDTFDRDLADIFAVQDEITEHVVNAIEPAMLESEGARASRGNVRDLSAFDCFQRGMWRLNQVSRDGFDEAQQLFEEAIRRDPGLSLAYTGLARIHYGKVVYGWSDDSDRDIANSHAAARAAIALDPRDSWAHSALAGALVFLGRHEEALREAEITVNLNANCALGQSRLAQALIYAGRAREAIAPMQRAIRHNPFDPQIGAFYTLLALAHYHAGNYEEAARQARNAVLHDDIRAAGLEGAALARLGRLDDAHRAFSPEVQQRASQAVRRMMPYAHQEDFLDLLEGLRLAGLGAPLLDGLREPPAAANEA